MSCGISAKLTTFNLTCLTKWIVVHLSWWVMWFHPTHLIVFLFLYNIVKAVISPLCVINTSAWLRPLCVNTIHLMFCTIKGETIQREHMLPDNGLGNPEFPKHTRTMMGSWHGNTFPITKPYVSISGGFLPQSANNPWLWCFPYWQPDHLLNKQLSYRWFNSTLCSCDVTEMSYAKNPKLFETHKA